MGAKHGNLSIDSENIFPIIKKWMYSDHDIFYREMVSNGCDAITKLKKLEMMGEYEFSDDYKPKITVTVNPEEKTLSFEDNGLGMTADEVEEYINQIAFSGATDFLEKYKDKANDDQIIGHFGLGFYSAFMVADEVHIDTLSWQDGAKAVHWECDGGTEFDMNDGDKDSVGTRITLFLNEDSLEFANEYRAREVLQKYCSFMPIEIYLEKANADTEYETIDEEDLRDTDEVIERITEEAKKDDDGKEISPEKKKVKIVKRPVPVNDTNPLWAKNPSECTEDDYKDFYRKVFNDFKEPLFWVHLNMDYPFNLKGIIYFPKINTEYDSIEGTIKLYNNQVFVADNIKEVIPEYFMLLKGVIDCPDLPLNVSRSALQNDGFVTKIQDYISKKLADKLIGMCKTEKEEYEKFWDDISPFIKYGCLKDEKFCDKMTDYILFKDINDEYKTLPEWIEKPQEKEEAVDENGEKVEVEEVSSGASDGADDGAVSDGADTDGAEDTDSDEPKEPEKKTIYYVSDMQQQGQYVKMFKEQGMNAVVLNHNIDNSFISQLEARNEGYRFLRIDADVTDALKDEDGEDVTKATESLSDIFSKALGREVKVVVENLKDKNIASMMTLSEEGRRFSDMMKMYGMNGMGMGMGGGDDLTLILNNNNELVQYIMEHKRSKNVPVFCRQLYDLALISNQPLDAESMAAFVARSNEIMLMLASK